MDTSRWMLLAAALVASSACTNDSLFDGEPEPATMLGLVGSEGDFAFYAETGRASYVWGFQGGAMITPRIQVPADLGGAGSEVQVTLENLTDPSNLVDLDLESWEPTGGDDLFELDEAGRTERIDDMISWSNPEGARFRLRATVRGADFALTETVALEVVAPPPPAAGTCASLLSPGPGCRYYVVPGAAVIESADADGDRCGWAVFEPADEAHRSCRPVIGSFPEGTMKLTPAFATPCPDGLEVGDEIDAELLLIHTGTCTPTILQTVL